MYSLTFILFWVWPAPSESSSGFVFIQNIPNYPKHRLSKVLELFPQDLSADSKAISSPSTFFFLQHSRFKHSATLLKITLLLENLRAATAENNRDTHWRHAGLILFPNLRNLKVYFSNEHCNQWQHTEQPGLFVLELWHATHSAERFRSYRSAIFTVSVWKC